MSTMVIAGTVQQARHIANNLSTAGAHATSPRSIRQGYGRGLVIDNVLIDDSAWPLPADVYEAIMPCLIASADGRIYRRTDAA